MATPAKRIATNERRTPKAQGLRPSSRPPTTMVGKVRLLRL